MKRKKINLEIYLAVFVVLVILFVGTTFYRYWENLNWVDSFYLTVTTVLTVGFGDLAPTRPISRVFTSIYVLISIPAMLFCLGLVIEGFLKRRIDGIEDEVEKMVNAEDEILKREEKILAEEKKD